MPGLVDSLFEHWYEWENNFDLIGLMSELRGTEYFAILEQNRGA